MPVSYLLPRHLQHCLQTGTGHWKNQSTHPPQRSLAGQNTASALALTSTYSHSVSQESWNEFYTNGKAKSKQVYEWPSPLFSAESAIPLPHLVSSFLLKLLPQEPIYSAEENHKHKKCLLEILPYPI